MNFKVFNRNKYLCYKVETQCTKQKKYPMKKIHKNNKNKILFYRCVRFIFSNVHMHWI